MEHEVPGSGEGLLAVGALQLHYLSATFVLAAICKNIFTYTVHNVFPNRRALFQRLLNVYRKKLSS